MEGRRLYTSKVVGSIPSGATIGNLVLQYHNNVPPRHQHSCHKKLQSLTVSRSSSSPPRSLLLRTGSLTHQPAIVCCDESFSPTTKSIGRLCSVVSSSPYPNYKQKRLLLAWQGSGVCAYIIIISERKKNKTTHRAEQSSSSFSSSQYSQKEKVWQNKQDTVLQT